MSDAEVVTVIERIPLKSGFATVSGALQAGQAYDDVTHENAHLQPGHVDHASFFFEPGARSGTGYLVLIYPWRGRPAVSELLESEASILNDWLAAYADGPRQVSVLTKIDVEIA
jgi:hypothetical protein